jgi:hypothetical protein
VFVLDTCRSLILRLGLVLTECCMNTGRFWEKRKQRVWGEARGIKYEVRQVGRRPLHCSAWRVLLEPRSDGDADGPPPPPLS